MVGTFSGGGNVFFHIRGKGNKNVQGLSDGQAVKYTQGVNAKGVYAENIVPIAGMRTSPLVLNMYQCVTFTSCSQFRLAPMYHSSSHLSSNSSNTSDFQTDLSSSSSRQTNNMEVIHGSRSEGFADGPGGGAQVNRLDGVAVYGEGSIIIAIIISGLCKGFHGIGTVSTLAGSGSAGFADGAGAAAQFNLSLIHI